MVALLLATALVMGADDPKEGAKKSSGNDVVDKMPPELIAGLKKNLKGQLAFDKKTGEVALAYDFANVKQMQDFEVSKTKPVLNNDGLCLGVGVNVKHVARFRTMRVSAELRLKQMRGQVLRTDRVSIGTGGLNPDTVYLGIEGHDGSSAIVPDKLRSGVVPIKLAIEDERTLFAWGDSTVGKDAPGVPAGQLQLFGGENGFCFKKLVIAGELEPAWAETITELKKKK
jgi:hypothetical protein